MINNTQSALLELIKSSLFGTAPDLPEETDFDAVFAEAKEHTVVALTAPAVPRDFADKWQDLASQSTAHYMRALFEQTNLVNLLSENKIPFVILKGMAAAVYYPNPCLRTTGDIDFIVAPQQYDDTVGLLDGNGYTQDDDHDTYRHCGFGKGGISLELHRRYSDNEFDLEPVITDGMTRAVIRTLNGHSFPTLPDCENGLVILDHIRHHLISGLGLRQIVDWTMFVNRVLTDGFYNEHFLPLLRSVGLETFCGVVTKMCKKYLFVPESVTWCDDADPEAADQLFESVLSSGNFGRKKADAPYVYRPMSTFAISVRKRGFFKALQAGGVENFAICKNNRFFRPFAWLFQLVRYIKRGLISVFKGEKLLGDMKDGNEKADFNDRLGI